MKTSSIFMVFCVLVTVMTFSSCFSGKGKENIVVTNYPSKSEIDKKKSIEDANKLMELKKLIYDFFGKDYYHYTSDSIALATIDNIRWGIVLTINKESKNLQEINSCRESLLKELDVISETIALAKSKMIPVSQKLIKASEEIQSQILENEKAYEASQRCLELSISELMKIDVVESYLRYLLGQTGKSFKCAIVFESPYKTDIRLTVSTKNMFGDVVSTDCSDQNDLIMVSPLFTNQEWKSKKIRILRKNLILLENTAKQPQTVQLCEYIGQETKWEKTNLDSWNYRFDQVDHVKTKSIDFLIKVGPGNLYWAFENDPNDNTKESISFEKNGKITINQSLLSLYMIYKLRSV